MDVGETAKWVKAERVRLGLTASELADRARQFAHSAGYTAALKQQSISAFENGTAKRMPGWIAYVRAALAAADKPYSSSQIEQADMHVMMRVALPSEAALARMFHGLLLPLNYREMEPAELARMLARRLPTGFAQLSDLMPEQPLAAASEGDEALRPRATDHPASPQSPRT